MCLIGANNWLGCQKDAAVAALIAGVVLIETDGAMEQERKRIELRESCDRSE